MLAWPSRPAGGRTGGRSVRSATTTATDAVTRVRAWGCPTTPRARSPNSTPHSGRPASEELIEHALDCPHRDLLTCPNFRSALEDHLELQR